MAAQTQESAVETASTVVTQVGDKAGQAVDMAKQKATSHLDSERARIAESIYKSAHALRQVGQQLREQDQGTIAGLAERAAQRAEDTSAYLRRRELPQVLDDTEQLGRAHPMLFTSAALGLGLLSIRFLKSSRSPSDTGTNNSAYILSDEQAGGSKTGMHDATSTAGGELPDAADDVDVAERSDEMGRMTAREGAPSGS
jgi:ElaB/YqjD/DUF883 family membrane-anchored ribosome-binding protein